MLRRMIVIGLAGAAVALVALGLHGGISFGKPQADYRDPVQLAQAVKDHERAASASCAKLPTGTYYCSVATSGGAVGGYTVTVAEDGKSWRAN
jgi:hypothetical protein